MVRLRVGHVLMKAAHEMPFQFQHGTIERLLVKQPQGRIALFQFQHGTIESARRGYRYRKRNDYFNSNMVRLRVVSCVALQAQEPYFNSNMVRLRDYFVNFNGTIFYVFQFQHGTIESKRGYKGCIAVRRFQFQHGTIERPARLPPWPPTQYFNSNMVRLRVGDSGRRKQG